jgi:hypothetical protein
MKAGIPSLSASWSLIGLGRKARDS